ncbi:MAG: peptidase M50 [Planctomycetia bacterium]|nr:peptidase M50 [Planctomycetia bacterium]
MQRNTTTSLWLFQAFGIDVYVHWSWFFVAVMQISSRPNEYTAFYWKVVEYLSLFALVLLHEFGHALACRSVGGEADTIILWPLGGIAFVRPPARPGAVLWSIFAGPLVNLTLILPLAILTLLTPPDTDLRHYLGITTLINIGLFCFNMLPVYPLDGGQILQALLWFAIGRWRSLQVVSAIGFVFGIASIGVLLLLVALQVVTLGSVLVLGLISLFVAVVSANSFRVARHAQHMQDLPRHADCACPSCLTGPPRGKFWTCEECEAQFDTFDTRGVCPDCGAWFLPTTCPDCRETHHIDRWFSCRPGVGLVEPEESSW